MRVFRECAMATMFACRVCICMDMSDILSVFFFSPHTNAIDLPPPAHTTAFPSSGSHRVAPSAASSAHRTPLPETSTFLAVSFQYRRVASVLLSSSSARVFRATPRTTAVHASAPPLARLVALYARQDVLAQAQEVIAVNAGHARGHRPGR